MEQFSNFGQSTLSTSVDASQTTITVADATSFPSSGNFRVTIGTEILLVTGVAGNVFTVTRGSDNGESTTAASHAAGATVQQNLTAAVMTDHESKLADHETRIGDLESGESDLPALPDGGAYVLNVDESATWRTVSDVGLSEFNNDIVSAAGLSGDYGDLTNAPGNLSDFNNDIFPVDAADTTGFADVATSGSYNDLSDVPDLATVATSGSYNDLDDTPAALSDFSNDIVSTAGISGSYNDLTDQPDIPSLPIDVANTTGFALVASSGSMGDLVDGPDQSLNTTDAVTFDEVHGRLFVVTDLTLGSGVIYDGASSQGEAGQVLTSNGASTPTWENAPNLFDQDLSTTDSVTFNSVTANGLNLTGGVITLPDGESYGATGQVLVSNGGSSNTWKTLPEYLQQVVIEFSTEWAEAEGVGYFVIPPELDGRTLTKVYGSAITAGTGSSADSFQVMQNGSLLLQVDHYQTLDAYTTTSTTLASYDRLRIDIVGVSDSTPAQGLIVTLVVT